MASISKEISFLSYMYSPHHLTMSQRALGVRTPDIGALRERRGSGTFLPGKKREKDAPHIFFVIRECPWEKPVHKFSSLPAFMPYSTPRNCSIHPTPEDN